MSICSNKGFSFIEMVVALVTVAALSTISIAQYSKYVINAKNAVANSNLKSYMVSQESFYIENNLYSNCADKSECQIVLPSYIGDSDLKLDAGSEVRWGPAADGSGQSYFMATVNHIDGNKSYTFTNQSGHQKSGDIVEASFPG